ncbi:integrase core domain-containing protein [Chlorobaculum parvum]|uniref:integrase core domain-containing protein n=1 Tax=Chlorobaculum parvum TaxID=274539 RepID=UPI0002F859DF
MPDFSRSGKPTDNPYIESFNRKLQDKCLSENWLLDMEDARQKIEAWRKEYSALWPHYSLKQVTPMECIATQCNRSENSNLAIPATGI